MAEKIKGTPMPMDPLEALMNVDKVAPEGTVYIKRLNASFTVKAPLGKEYKALLDRCVVEVGKGRNRSRNLDFDKFSKLLVYTFTIDPKLDDPGLMEKYGVLAPEDVVDKALLAGEIEKLSEKILELGGYGDDDDLVEEAKN